MTIRELIEQADEIAGSTLSDDTMLSLFNEIEGKIALEWVGVDAWTSYEEEDLDAEPLIPEPWGRGIYVPYLEAQIYYAHGEYDRYENAREMHETNYLDFRKHVRRTHCSPCCPCRGSMNTAYTEEDPLNVYSH